MFNFSHHCFLIILWCAQEQHVSEVQEMPGTVNGVLIKIYRDHCSCAECRHPETKQRLLDTFMVKIILFQTRPEKLLAVLMNMPRCPPPA